MRLIDISREKKIFHGSFTDVKIRWISDENENTENSGAIPPAKTNSDHILKMVATLNRERTCCVKNYYYVNPIGKPYSISRTIWFGCYGNALVNFYQQLPRTAFDRHVWYVCVCDLGQAQSHPFEPNAWLVSREQLFSTVIVTDD